MHTRFHHLTKLIRERFHPLQQLRKSKFFVSSVMPIIDVPIWCNLHLVDWKVRVRFATHLSWVLNDKIIEPGIGSLFVAIYKTIHPTIFWDVGANIGFYTWLMLSLDESMHAVLFEPDPPHVELLKETLVHAGVTRAQLMRYAVSDVA